MRTLFTVTVLTLALGPQEPMRFRPYPDRAFALVNAVAFAPAGDRLYMTLFHRRVLARAGTDTTHAPELAIYSAVRTADGWGEPRLLEFSGRHEDYEPTLSPAGDVIVFNSRRPHDYGRIPEHNDLWIARRSGTGWGEPRRIRGLGSFDGEESYAALTADERVIFHARTRANGVERSDLYSARLRGDSAIDVMRLPFTTVEFAEADPWVAPDGSYLLFARSSEQGSWETTCDLYVSFATDGTWSTPVPLTGANTPGPDYAPAVTPDGRTLVARANHVLLSRPLQPLLDAALNAGSGAGRSGVRARPAATLRLRR